MAIDTVGKREAMAATYASDAAYMSLHTADPAGTGANEVSGGSPAYARQPLTWTAGAVDGAYTATVAADFDVPGSTNIAFVGLWTAATGGTYLDKAALAVTFAAQGKLTVAQITFTQS